MQAHRGGTVAGAFLLPVISANVFYFRFEIITRDGPSRVIIISNLFFFGGDRGAREEDLCHRLTMLGTSLLCHMLAPRTT